MTAGRPCPRRALAVSGRSAVLAAAAAAAAAAVLALVVCPLVVVAAGVPAVAHPSGGAPALGVSARFTREVVDTCAGIVTRGPVQCPCDFSMEVRTPGLIDSVAWELQATAQRNGKEVEVLRVSRVAATQPARDTDTPGEYTSGVVYRSISEAAAVSFRLSLVAESLAAECKNALVRAGMEPKPDACPVRNVSPGGKGGNGESTPPTGPATRVLARGGGGVLDTHVLGAHAPAAAPVARVVGGRPVRTPAEQSLLARVLGPTGTCTGSFLPPHHVVTAAHCDVSLGTTVQVFPPARGRGAPGVINMTVATAANHPRYVSRPRPLHDVAVLTLRPPTDRAADVIAAAPWPQLRLNGDADVPAAGDAVRTAGFGLVVDAGPFSDGPLFVDQPALTPAQAAAYQRDVEEPVDYPDGRDGPIPPEERLDHPAVLCTAVWRGDCSACQGDSGGPVYHVVPPSRAGRGAPTYVQVGITSYGRGCGVPDTIDVTARVATLKGWIDWQMRAAPGGTAGAEPATQS